jgi:DNA-directed RNA polymerase subunit M/transcription elongation factor TFIIS
MNQQKMSTFKGMRFCKECDNMLYPKEQIISSDNNQKRLVYDCRICGYFEKAKVGDESDNCVYKSDYSKMSQGFNIDKECIKDPTLSRSKNIDCEKCHHNEAVTFTNPTKDRMNLIFVCTKCSFYWKKDKIDEQHDILSESDSD